MRYHLGLTLLLAGSFGPGEFARAQTSNVTHGSWTAWLGCWAPDANRVGAPANMQASVTCIVPVPGSRAVDELTLAADTVVARTHWPLVTPGAQPFIEQDCRGREAVSWSASRRRAYLHAEYACEDSTRGTSATLLAFSATGVWLRVNEVRANGGVNVTVERLREVPTPVGLPAAATRAITQQSRAIATARAAASAPIRVEEIVDALDAVDSNVVRMWVLASEQRFALNASEAALLRNANLPASVLQAMLGGTVGQREARPAPTGETVFAGTPTYVISSYAGPSTVYFCQPYACYTSQPYPVAYAVPLYPAYGAYPYYYDYSSSWHGHPRPIIRYRGAQPSMHGVPVSTTRPIVAAPQPRPLAPYVYRRRP